MNDFENQFQTILSKHILVFTPDYHVVVYSWRAMQELANYFKDYQTKNSDFKYTSMAQSTAPGDYAGADAWGAFSWIDNGEVKMFGINFMQEAQENRFKQFNSTYN